MKHEEMAREPVKPDFIQGTRSTAQFLRANYNDLSRQEAEVIALRLEEAASALAQVEAETLERAAAHIDVPYTRTGHEFAAALRSLSPNPTPTKSVVPEGMVLVPREITLEMQKWSSSSASRWKSSACRPRRRSRSGRR